MKFRSRPKNPNVHGWRWLLTSRRGVVSVLSMMFVILFGSLAVAMAIMSRSNIQTAATHQHVTRAMGAAETGLAVAQQRLIEAAGRFVVERGTVDPDFGRRLWTGNFTSIDGQVTILPPRTYIDNQGQPKGLAEALAQIHAQDVNIVVINGIASPTIAEAAPGTDPAEYLLDDWVRTPGIAMMQQSGTRPRDVAFQIEYALLANGTDVRVFVTGYDFDYESRGQPITRRIIQDFSIVKRVNTAVLSPSKIMIGKNVMVEGDLGAVFTDVQQDFGDPLIMKSDFWGLDPGLDAELTKLFDALALYDVDRDNRLRIHHPIEGQNLPDYSNLGYPGLSADVTGDGYLDEFDVFIMYFDDDRDGQVVLSSALTVGTPAEGRTPEFTLDDDLAHLIDASRPDRNRNGVFGYINNSGTGSFVPGVDELLDYEYVVPAMLPPHLQSYVSYKGTNAVLYRDQVLGYRDGVIDKRDQYAKVTGSIVFRVSEGEWSAGQGHDFMKRVRGPIREEHGESPVHFAAQPQSLPDLSSANFTNSQTALRNAANGSSFEAQVAANLGLSDPSELATWDPSATGPNGTKYQPLLPPNSESLPANWQTAYFERMPFNSPSFFDFYYRPVYENMTFRNVQIPPGNNGLFINCTFVGVTYVRVHTANSHPNWAIYGRLTMDHISGRPRPFPTRNEYVGTHPPNVLAGLPGPILIGTPPLDKGDIPQDEVSNYSNYNSLPEPLVINGNRVIDTKLFSNNIRFHDSLFVGSIVSDSTVNYTNSRNKLQFTGATRFSQQHPDEPHNSALNPDPSALGEIAKSSMMLPNYSVDIGHFNSPPEQDVRLKGAIVAGVLDIRGNAEIDGALLLSFKPTLGQPPLVDNSGNPIGNPALFNATIGYFGPEDGDEESLDPATLPYFNGEKIVGWDTNGDKLPDVGPHEPQPPGSDPVPFWGYGRVVLRFDPNMALPDGILLPLQVQPRRETYREVAQ